MSQSSTTTARPALLGGSPAVTAPQDEAFRWPVITDEDEAAVLDVMRSGHLSLHPIVGELEQDYRTWTGRAHALAHNNGTGALHGAMHAIGIEPGDEVIVQSATWWASVMPILHQGGVPVFAECELDCGGLDPADVERRITPRTKAIVVVHLFGMPSKMAELTALAKKHGLRIIEDASHAHGAKYRGQQIGTFGDISVFSMQANKLVPSAEGGVLLTDDHDLYIRALRYGHYERLIPMKDEPNRRFAATGFGMKFRMSPLSAAVARVQLRHLDARNAVRNANCIKLSQRLEPLGVQTFLAPDDLDRVYFEFLVRWPETNGLSAPMLAQALQAEGVQVAAPRYPLLHQQPMFTEGAWLDIARLRAWYESRGETPPTYDPRTLPVTHQSNATLLKLPNFPHAADELIEQYAQAFEKVIAHADVLLSEMPTSA